MPRTDEEIYAYMQYYNTTTDRKWAFENLCRVEHKTPEEIKEICRKEGERVMRYDQQLKEMIICDRLKGIPASRIAVEQGMTEKQVENIFTRWKQEQKKQPEAYPGQINDGYETADKPPEKIPYKKPEIIPKPVPNGYWYALLGELQNFAEGVLGTGTKVVRATADEADGLAALVIETADGKRVGMTVLTIEK